MKIVIAGDRDSDSWQAFYMPTPESEYIFENDIGPFLPGLFQGGFIPGFGFADFAKCSGFSDFAGCLGQMEILTGEWDMIRPAGGIAPSWDMIRPAFESLPPESYFRKWRESGGFDDFSFNWGVFATLFSSILGAFGKGGGYESAAHSSGWNQMISNLAQYGITFENPKFAFCCCPSGSCWRVNLNDRGQVELASRERTGLNPRIDCRCLIPQAYQAIQNCGDIPSGSTCQGGFVQGGTGGTGSDPTGTGGITFKDPGGAAGDWFNKYKWWLVGGFGVFLLVTALPKRRRRR